MHYFRCGVVHYRNLADTLGTTCGREAKTICYDCGTSLCGPHTVVCEFCKEKFCQSCLSFHLNEHSKSSTADRPAGKKKTA